jgi:hypothetical protein
MLQLHVTSLSYVTINSSIPPLYVVCYYYVVPSISLLVDLMVELTDVLFQTRKPNWVILTNWNNRSA